MRYFICVVLAIIAGFALLKGANNNLGISIAVEVGIVSLLTMLDGILNTLLEIKKLLKEKK